MHRHARRRPHAPLPRRPALRPVPRADDVPVVPRPGVHDRLPGRLDPARRQPADRHRGLVHRLPALRQELPLRLDPDARPRPHPGADARLAVPARLRRRGRRRGPSRSFDDRDWMPGATPFLWDRDMEALVAGRGRAGLRVPLHLPARRRAAEEPRGGVQAVARLRRARDGRRGQGARGQAHGHRRRLAQRDASCRSTSGRSQNKQFVFELAGETRRLLRAGKNVIAARATGVPGKRGVLLQVALDEVRPSGAVLPLKAVVCDQCSTLPGQMQACVHACPHDAAKRVDAWTAFPAR